MGLFLQTLIVPDKEQQQVAQAVAAAARLHPGFELDPSKCQYRQGEKGTQVLCSCNGYDSLAREISQQVQGPAMLLYIYDEDFWGYYLYDAGQQVDQFCPMPDYFEEVTPQQAEKMAGSSEVLSRYFGVQPKAVERYLQTWTDELMEQGGKAYHKDEFDRCDCWQMADFMERLGFPYAFD